MKSPQKFSPQQQAELCIIGAMTNKNQRKERQALIHKFLDKYASEGRNYNTIDVCARSYHSKSNKPVKEHNNKKAIITSPQKESLVVSAYSIDTDKIVMSGNQIRIKPVYAEFKNGEFVFTF